MNWSELFFLGGFGAVALAFVGFTIYSFFKIKPIKKSPDKFKGTPSAFNIAEEVMTIALEEYALSKRRSIEQTGSSKG